MAASNITVNDDLVQQYISITGADKTIASNMLIALNGNLEMAVNMYLEGSFLPGPSESFSSTSDNMFSAQYQSKKSKDTANALNVAQEKVEALDDFYNTDDNIRSPIPQQQAVLVEDPYHALPSSRPRRPQTCSVFDSFRDFKQETDEQEHFLMLHPQGIPPHKKTKRLHELFKPPRDILYGGDFQSARSFSKNHNRWLLVNIQNSTEFACQVMNRDVWSNKLVREILKENFVLWQVDYESDEGMHYSNFYDVHNYPHLAVIDPRTGERLVVWENLSMKPTAEQFAELATLFLSDHSNLNDSFHTHIEKVAGVMKTDIDDDNENDNINAALKASLEDNSNILSVVSDSENYSDQETYADVEKKDNQRLDATKQINKPNLLLNTADEMEDDNVEKATIMCRLPNNERKVISISFHSTIKYLSEKIALLGWPSEQYELIKAFPRQNISELDCQLSLKDAGLHKQETVFVQER